MLKILGKVLFRISRILLGKFGYAISLSTAPALYPELTDDEIKFLQSVHGASITFTSFESLSTLAICCKYLSQQNIIGDFVEAGVWRGGSSIVAKKFLKSSKNYYLYDTYGG